MARHQRSRDGGTMSLRLPEEIVVDRFLPTVRAMLAAELAEAGLTQQAIADRLGVTQAAVSKYVGGAVEGDDRIREDPRTVATVERIAAGLADGELDGYDALAELVGLVRALEDRGPICAIHEEAMPALQGLGCDLCVRGMDADVQVERDALADVRRAARALSTAAGVARAIPNVGTNVGSALPDATAVTDVAAIPGRIYAVDGRVEVPANPEFGASRHVATAILAAAAAGHDVRGAINLVTDEAILDAARERGIEPVEFDAGYDDRRDRLESLLAGRDDVRVLFHRGDFGIEPITYVLGADAVRAAELAIELVGAALESSP